MYIPRILEKQVKKSFSNRKILFIIGARQVGKTTLIEHLLKENSGVILNLDIEIDKAKLVSASKLPSGQAMKMLGVNNILVIDEAHRYPDIGRIVKGWYDSKLKIKFILLGSSSINLLDKTAESLAGRNEKLFLTPLLFEEVLQTQSWFDNKLKTKSLSDDFKNQIQSLALERLVFGGYPEVFLTGDKENCLLNLTTDYLLKDVLQSNLVKNPESIKRLLLLLAYQIGSEVSISELAVNLKISRQTVEKYIDLLERIFVIFRLRSFSTNPRKEIVKSSKIYFGDTGIKNALQKEFNVSDLRSDIGALWENWIIGELMKRNISYRLNQDFYFWRTRDGSEIDLIIKDAKGQIKSFEIKWSPKKRSKKSSFFGRYGVQTHLIHRENFLLHLKNRKA